MKIRIWFVAAGTLVLGGSGMGAEAQPEITAAELRAHVEFLASPELEGRKLGTKGAEKTEAYIAAAMQACGLKPLGDQGGYFQEFDVERGGKGRNVIGMIEGGDASLREQVVVLGAHHDHVGVVSEPGEAGTPAQPRTRASASRKQVLALESEKSSLSLRSSRSPKLFQSAVHAPLSKRDRFPPQARSRTQNPWS